MVVFSRIQVCLSGIFLSIAMMPSAQAKGPIPIAIGSASGQDSGDLSSHKTYSVGKPQVGALLNAIPLEAGAAFTIRPKRNYGTPELIDVLEAAGNDVLSRFPKSPRLYVGDLSYAHGGPIGSHVSHQSGRDADVSYYLKKGHSAQRFKHASAKNLDAGRTWAFIESLLRSGHAQMIFTDRRLIKVLRNHAEHVAKVDKKLLRRWFDGDQTIPGQKPILRHLKGHQNHIHLRVYAPQSQVSLAELGGGKLASQARRTLAEAHRFRGSNMKESDHHDHHHHYHHNDTAPHATALAASEPPLRNHPELNPGFKPKELNALLTRTARNGRSPASRARAKARRARTRARQARRRASRARVKWYGRYPERLAYQ